MGSTNVISEVATDAALVCSVQCTFILYVYAHTFSCRPFFDLCDGIFLNYGWNEPLLRASVELAGSRRGEVYVGVDVFGRGCYGGGGYNTDKEIGRAHV